MKSFLAGLLEQIHKGKRIALTTIINVDGSAPQVIGASALFSSKGLVRGTLGGGSLEAWAERRSIAALKERRSGVAGLDLRGEFGSAAEAVCGGAVTILIDAAPERHARVFQRVEASLAAGKRGILATLVRPGRDRCLVITRRWIVEDRIRSAIHAPELRPFAREIKSALVRAVRPAANRESLLYAELHEPRPRLIIAGAGHIGQALCRLAAGLDFEVTVADDRPEYANAERLPDADKIVTGNIARAVSRLSARREPYVVIVTRGHSNDAEVLRACIKQPAAYIGMIGSHRKVVLMRRNFIRNRWATPREFDRVSTPIGLGIRARTVEEIAVSIAAELIRTRRSSQEDPARREPWFGP